MTEREKIIDCMADNLDCSHDPKVGFFWYDPEKDELFGVNTANADELKFNKNGYKTLGTLHKDWWTKQQHKAKAKKQLNSIFMTDYTMIPRGRVFQKEAGNVFQLMAGQWIKDYEHVVDLVKIEFDLSNVNFELVIDKHWDIGHGWSEEFL